MAAPTRGRCTRGSNEARAKVLITNPKSVHLSRRTVHPWRGDEWELSKDTSGSPDDGLLLGQRRRRWANIPDLIHYAV